VSMVYVPCRRARAACACNGNRFVNDNMVEVLDGLSDGDRIVTGGQNKLREGSKIKLEGQGAK